MVSVSFDRENKIYVNKGRRPYSRCNKKRQIDVSAGWVDSDRTSVTFLRGNYEFFFSK